MGKKTQRVRKSANSHHRTEAEAHEITNGGRPRRQSQGGQHAEQMGSTSQSMKCADSQSRMTVAVRAVFTLEMARAVNVDVGMMLAIMGMLMSVDVRPKSLL